MWSRRRFIFVGAAGALAAGAIWVAPRVMKSGAAPKGSVLVSENQDMLRAVASAVLGPALPTAGTGRAESIARVLTATGALIDNFPPSTRREVADLFGLLALKPARVLLGYSGDWPEAEASAVTSFLVGLRDSSIALKQQAYFALHDMVLGSYYAEPMTWAPTGYPGPPKLA